MRIMVLLDVDDVTIRFGGLIAVKSCSFRVHGGGVTCLVGPNGAGKTTIFNAITGYVRPEKGRISVKGTETTGMPPHKIARLGVGRTFQNLRLFEEFTVLNNVLSYFAALPGQRAYESIFLAPRVRKAVRDAKQKAVELLRVVGLEEKQEEYAANLSYGDQKLLAIARILVNDPDLMLLDEPTSGLDRHAFDKVVRVIQYLARERQKTILLIEHNMDTVKLVADRVLFLNQGTVLGDGTPMEIMSNRELTDIYFGVTRSGRDRAGA